MGYNISDCLKFCCRFQSYLDHLAMQENDEDSECEELERKMFQCKERTVSSHLPLYSSGPSAHPATSLVTTTALLLCCLSLQKGLWRMFARNVISFKRGLRNPTILKQLQRFLAEETNRGRPHYITHMVYQRSNLAHCEQPPCQ